MVRSGPRPQCAPPSTVVTVALEHRHETRRPPTVRLAVNQRVHARKEDQHDHAAEDPEGQRHVGVAAGHQRQLQEPLEHRRVELPQVALAEDGVALEQVLLVVLEGGADDVHLRLREPLLREGEVNRDGGHGGENHRRQKMLRFRNRPHRMSKCNCKMIV